MLAERRRGVPGRPCPAALLIQMGAAQSLTKGGTHVSRMDRREFHSGERTRENGVTGRVDEYGTSIDRGECGGEPCGGDCVCDFSGAGAARSAGAAATRKVGGDRACRFGSFVECRVVSRAAAAGGRRADGSGGGAVFGAESAAGGAAGSFAGGEPAPVRAGRVHCKRGGDRDALARAGVARGAASERAAADRGRVRRADGGCGGGDSAARWRRSAGAAFSNPGGDGVAGVCGDAGPYGV